VSNQSKQTIRKSYQDIRNHLSQGQVIEKSRQIVDNLSSLEEYLSSKTVMCYVSAKNEVSTHEMIKAALTAKRVAVPVTNKTTGYLSFVRLSSFDELRASTYGILEPESGERISAKDIDLFIVPGIAFDMEGNRIGYGKGYFDKALIGAKAPIAGLAFECQLAPEIPKDTYDIGVSIIVTEDRVIRCGQ
jgi:5-formyltetrahydrofolate cyclo-ligase